jgi:hypothetical protein
MSDKPAPKFKVGQIVVMKGLKKQLPFRILRTEWSDGWFYAWNRRNFASEDMIRALTPDEIGEAISAE